MLAPPALQSRGASASGPRAEVSPTLSFSRSSNACGQECCLKVRLFVACSVILCSAVLRSRALFLYIVLPVCCMQCRFMWGYSPFSRVVFVYCVACLLHAVLFYVGLFSVLECCFYILCCSSFCSSNILYSAVFLFQAALFYVDLYYILKHHHFDIALFSFLKQRQCTSHVFSAC